MYYSQKQLVRTVYHLYECCWPFRSSIKCWINSVARKCYRWWKTLFSHLIAIVNGFILFREYRERFPDDEVLQRPRNYTRRELRAEISRDFCDFPEYGLPHYILQPNLPLWESLTPSICHAFQRTPRSIVLFVTNRIEVSWEYLPIVVLLSAEGFYTLLVIGIASSK